MRGATKDTTLYSVFEREEREERMSADTVRKAIQDAAVEVRDYARAEGPRQALRRDWKGHAATLSPASVPPGELGQYRETFAVAAEHAAALVADMS